MFEQPELRSKRSSHCPPSPESKPFTGYLKSIEEKNAFYHYKRSSNRLFLFGSPQ